jgi:hypothetical protein
MINCAFCKFWDEHDPDVAHDISAHNGVTDQPWGICDFNQKQMFVGLPVEVLLNLKPGDACLSTAGSFGCTSGQAKEPSDG